MHSSIKIVKYIFFFLIFFFFAFHFALPAVFYSIKGYSPTYQSEFFDRSAIVKGILLNFFSLVIGAVLIFFTKTKIKIKEVNYKSHLYLLISVLITLGSAWTIGDYANAIKTLEAPKGFFIFSGMFFNLDFYFLFAMASSIEFFPSSQYIYILRGILNGSRSASLLVFLYFIYSLWSKHSKRFYKKYIIYFVLSFALSLFSFKWANHIRYEQTQEKKEIPAIAAPMDQATTIPTPAPILSPVPAPTPTITAKVTESFQVSDSLIQQVMGRISFLELTMLPIIHKDQSIKNIEYFYSKYSLLNQAKLVVNNLIPMHFFDFDVYPSQYYRSAFMGMPLQAAKETYMSANMTLPVYFYMYFNFYLAALLGGLAIWAYYLLTLQAFKIHPLVGSVFIFVFYSAFLCYFDWIMIIKPAVVGILSIGLYIGCSKIQDALYSIFFKNKKEEVAGL